MSYGQQPGYGAPPPGQPGYSAPPPGQQGYGAPPPGQQGYGAPPPGQQGYSAPAPGQGYGPPGGQPGYSAPPAANPGYGAPPGGQGGYGAPPAGQSGYRAPPPAQQGYGAAPQQGGYGQAGYGAPAGGAPGGPPPGVDPTVYQWFMSVDQDRSGSISAVELQQALTNNNWSHFNAETCRLMIGMFDRNNDGTINLQEFGALWAYISQWKGVFDGFDRDKSGNIDAGELHNAVTQMGFRVSMNFVHMTIMKYDRIGRRSVKFDDFIQICVLLRSLTDAFRQRDSNQNGKIQINYEDFMSLAMSYKP